MVKVKKNVKKSFFEVKIPLSSAKISLYGESPESLQGRFVKLDLTRNLKGKNLEIKYKIVMDNGVLVGEPVSLQLIGSYMRRMMRRGTDYVEDSFNAECKDTKVIVKPFMVTRNKVSREIRNNLREEAKKYLLGLCKTRSSTEIFSDITTNKIQRELSLKLKKIYPLAMCEIRVFEKVKSEKTVRT